MGYFGNDLPTAKEMSGHIHNMAYIKLPTALA